jgi:hypothetical protein
VVTPNAKQQQQPRGRRHDASAVNDPVTAALSVAEPGLSPVRVPHHLSPLPTGGKQSLLMSTMAGPFLFHDGIPAANAVVVGCLTLFSPSIFLFSSDDPPGAICGSAAGAEKKRAASPRPVRRSKKQHRSSSSQNKTTAAAASKKQEQPTEEKKKKKKLTYREKGAPGCSRCRYIGCGKCYVIVTPTIVAPGVVEPGGSPSVALGAPSNDTPAAAAATRTKDHDDEKTKPPVAAAASKTRPAKDASAPTAAAATADASSAEDIERRLLRIGRAASTDYSRLLSLRSFPAESADGGGHGLFLNGDQTELGLLLELQTWVDQKKCSVCHARMGMYVVLHDVLHFPRFFHGPPRTHAHTRHRVSVPCFLFVNHPGSSIAAAAAAPPASCHRRPRTVRRPRSSCRRRQRISAPSVPAASSTIPTKKTSSGEPMTPARCFTTTRCATNCGISLRPCALNGAVVATTTVAATLPRPFRFMPPVKSPPPHCTCTGLFGRCSCDCSGLNERRSSRDRLAAGARTTIRRMRLATVTTTTISTNRSNNNREYEVKK